ncbi:uncharacterized protein N7496_005835 [Penicillium cataractarum]|uniref:Zn(2)-C6 fungal-type domain-containing protein n=1 Tax=Penicillium cataractarum TaxID=2100454 RepID=A0A9W9V5K0_9EURO|nr:uncharacterized protein N7496_005835 [Penicillium cataractarum]KAJ5369743.1 hypothetical protein N7496_005835 [Penicillium cataractarum]
MAYSPDRLEKARRLFPGHTQAAFECEDTYHLRSRNKSTTSVMSSWIDNDKDDDYTPERSSRSKRQIRSDREARSRARPAKRARSHSPTPTSSLDADNEADAPCSSSPVTPEDTPGQSKWETFWQPQIERDPEKAYFFRARKDAADSPGSPDIGHDNQSGLPEENNPAARGCLACQELDLECSLVDDPSHYPCENCRDDECDCIPDPPPIWKRPCEPCKSRRRLRCSYLSGDYDHSQPCWECLQHGFQCVAGPARCQPTGEHLMVSTETETTDEYHDDGTPEESSSGPEQNSKPKSMLHESGGILPATTARINHFTTRVSLSSTQGPSIQGPHTPAASGLPQCLIPTFDNLSSNPYGTSYRIRTYYPHPLTILSPNSQLSCHWCSNFAYGIVGLGPRNTDILDFETGRLIELSDGHQGEGKEPSRMCWDCARERLQIMQCCHDFISPLLNHMNPHLPYNPTGAYYHLAQARAALQEPSSRCYGQSFPHAPQPWCSLCQEPAFWSCDSDQTAQVSSQGPFQDVTTIHIGCGLFLCHYCAHHVNQFRGDLDRVVAWGKQDPKNKTEFRADVDYILKGSKGNYLRRQIYKS